MAETAEAVTRTKPTAKLQPHTRQVLREEKIGKGFLWFFAWLTVITLVVIVGYIVVNGLYTRIVTTDTVTPIVQESVPLVGLPRGAKSNKSYNDFEHAQEALADAPSFSVVVPRSLRLKDLKYGQLREIFAGLQTYLGYITKQNVSATTVLFTDGAFERLVSEYLLLGENYATAFDEKIVRVSTKQEIAEAINAFDGTIALVPTRIAEKLDGVRTVGIRQISIAVHPDINALQRGRRLEVLTMDQASSLMQGKKRSWDSVGGPSIEITPAKPKQGFEGEYKPLPVQPVVLNPSTELGAEIAQQVAWDKAAAPDNQSTARQVRTLSGFVDTVNRNSGSIGMIRAREAKQQKLNLIEVERVTHAPNIRLSTIIKPPSRAGAVGGLSTIIINTLVMVLFVVLITTPIGVAAAVYLVEYARQGPLLKALRVGTDTLAGVPSIIFGLFGMVFFAEFLRLKTGLLSGTLTLTLMVLPTVVRTSEEALKSVSRALREGSFALGATKIQTIFRVIIPTALPGIATGMILAIGRAVGETAALLFTMGSNLALIRSFNSPIRVLSVHLYMLIRENISFSNAFAAALLLIVIVFAVNSVTNRLIGRMNNVKV